MENNQRDVLQAGLTLTDQSTMSVAVLRDLCVPCGRWLFRKIAR